VTLPCVGVRREEAHSFVVLVCCCSVPHAVKGESIYAYVTLLDEAAPTAKLHAELVNLVKTQIGSFAAPDVIHWVSGAASSDSVINGIIDASLYAVVLPASLMLSASVRLL
jgi:hypothetical protein